MKLLFATQNRHKLEEIKNMLGDEFKLIGLNDVNFFGELEEDYNTLEGNASQKAIFVYQKFGYNCFADDTGLEIDALNGLPGSKSARYAGDDKDANDNIDKVLREMSEKKNRKARFRTVISLIIDDTEKQFEGIVEGEILTEKRGKQGFGYDPIFQPTGYNRSFAELGLNEKNKISHRGIAFRKLVEYLKNYLNA